MLHNLMYMNREAVEFSKKIWIIASQDIEKLFYNTFNIALAKYFA